MPHLSDSSKKILLSLLLGILTWIISTFLMGSIWSMNHSPTDPISMSSNLRNFIFLPPSLALSILLVLKGYKRFLKRCLVAVSLGLIL